MRILERYTLRTYAGPLLWCLLIFIGMYLVMDLLGHLDEILRYKVPARLLATYYGTMVPLVFVQVAPFACLMATLYALGNLNRHQELMAMRASGVGPWRIVRPLVWIGLLMSAAVLIVNETVAPQAALTADFIKESRLERPPDPSKPHRVFKTIEHLAAYGQGHALLYAREFDLSDKTMKGIVILQQGRDLRLQRKITAESAVWTGSEWRFQNGTILHYGKDGQAIGRPVPFESKAIRAGDRPEMLAKSESQASFMNTRDLRRHLWRLRGTNRETLRKLEVDLFAKTAAPAACLVMTLIGIPFAIQPVRGGTALGLSIGLGVGLAYYAANAIALALGKGGLLPPVVAAWAAAAGFAWYGIRMTWRRLA